MHSILPDRARALVKNGSSLGVRPLDAPGEPGPEEVIVRVAFAGVCRTDLYAAEGRVATAPRVVLGHEASGVVALAGARAGVRPGEAVTIVPLVACGRCAACARAADPFACEAPSRIGVDRDGVFASWVRLPSSSVRIVPTSLPLRVAAYVEPVAAAMAVTAARSRAGARVLVYGKNRIAELTRRVLVADGAAEVVVVSPEEAADVAPSSFDLAVETIATSEMLHRLSRAVRRGGAIVLKSRPFEPIALDVAAVVEKELTLEAVRYAPFEDAITHLASKRIEVDDLLGDVFPLERFEDAFAAARREANKPMFRMEGA